MTFTSLVATVPQESDLHAKTEIKEVTKPFDIVQESLATFTAITQPQWPGARSTT